MVVIDKFLRKTGVGLDDDQDLKMQIFRRILNIFQRNSLLRTTLS